MNWGFAATATSKSAPSRRPELLRYPLALGCPLSPIATVTFAEAIVVVLTV
jgi:hypothetical protein